jgi:hypothetical protein
MIMACLKVVGKVDSEMQRLRRVVMGGSKASRHDLRSLVGKISRVHVASVEERIILLTSLVETGAKLVIGGADLVGRM